VRQAARVNLRGIIICGTCARAHAGAANATDAANAGDPAPYIAGAADALTHRLQCCVVLVALRELRTYLEVHGAEPAARHAVVALAMPTVSHIGASLLHTLRHAVVAAALLVEGAPRQADALHVAALHDAAVHAVGPRRLSQAILFLASGALNAGNKAGLALLREGADTFTVRPSWQAKTLSSSQ